MLSSTPRYTLKLKNDFRSDKPFHAEVYVDGKLLYETIAYEKATDAFEDASVAMRHTLGDDTD